MDSKELLKAIRKIVSEELDEKLDINQLTGKVEGMKRVVGLMASYVGCHFFNTSFA